MLSYKFLVHLQNPLKDRDLAEGNYVPAVKPVDNGAPSLW
jgi:hypothetical protein